MREENVTKNILIWLQSYGWKIISYDFPQSGTGILLHPNSDENRTTKNKGGIIPDILATRNSIALFFENKDRFVLSDFEKLKEIKTIGNFSNSLNSILSDFNVSSIYYGIGIPAIEKHINKSLENSDGIDFIVSSDEKGEIKIIYDIKNIYP